MWLRLGLRGVFGLVAFWWVDVAFCGVAFVDGDVVGAAIDASVVVDMVIYLALCVRLNGLPAK